MPSVDSKILHSVFQHLPKTAIYFFDQAFRLTSAEGSDLENQGFSPQMIGQVIWDAACLVDGLEKPCRGALQGEETTLSASKDHRNYSIRIFPLPGDEYDEAEAVIGAIIVQCKTPPQPSLDAQQQGLLLFEKSDHAMFVMDMDGCFINVNSQAANLIGRGHEDIIGASHFDFTARVDQGYLKNILKKLRRGQEKASYEHTFTHQDGSRRIVEVSATTVFDAEGNPNFVQGLMHDITEQKATQQALHLSEERYRTINELILDFAYAYEVKLDGSIEHEWVTEDALRRLTGWSTEELKEKGPFALFHPDERETMQRLQQRVINGEIIKGEHRIITKDGRVRWLQINRQPVWDDLVQRVVRYYGVAQDITERKNAENALRKSEERYRVLTELMTDYAFSAFVVDDHLETEWLTDDSYVRITGYTRDEIVGRTLIHPEDRQRVDEGRKRVIDGEFTSTEYRIITKDGDVRWIQLDCYPVWDEAHQNVIRVYGVGQDKTASKLAEDALRESEIRYRILTELMSDYAFSARVVGDRLELDWLTDESYMRITGYTHSELEGRTLIHPEDRQRVDKERKEVIKGKRTSTEYRIITKEGDVRWIQLNRYPVWDQAHEKIIQIYGVARDITTSKLAEDALRKSEERFRMIAQVTLDGLYDFDIPQDNYWMSDSYRYLLGLKAIPDNLLKWWESHLHPDDLSDWREQIDAIMVGKQTFWQREYRLRHNLQQHYITILDRGYAIPNESGATERIIGALTDVTQARESERRKMDLALMQEKMRFFTDFVTAISHDFRTPLSIITTSAYIIERSPDKSTQADHVNQVKHQVEHIEKLVDGLLTIVQLDNLSTFKFEPVDVNLLLTYIQVSEEAALRQKRIQITLELDKQLPMVMGDNHWLYRCLENLVVNARHYTPENGKISISTLYEDEHVIVQIQDNGIGIAPEHLSHIFTPLYRVKSHRPSDGQGLGLAIAWKIAELHGGYITVESELDEGSTFTIYLPLGDDQAHVLESPNDGP
ncbi:MAG: PAS domain S-box protein [Anaerolineae bacterium]|nr:PAS domain S-box protein [Anaerolineae bacterium]